MSKLSKQVEACGLEIIFIPLVEYDLPKAPLYPQELIDSIIGAYNTSIKEDTPSPMWFCAKVQIIIPNTDIESEYFHLPCCHGHSSFEGFKNEDNGDFDELILECLSNFVCVSDQIQDNKKRYKIDKLIDQHCQT